MSHWNAFEYDDLIVRHRQASDILWSLKSWHHPVFDNKEQSRKSKQLINKNTQISSIITSVHYENLPRTSEQIKTDVLNSLPLKYTIETLDNESNAIEQAKNILFQMSHRLNMRSVRFLAFIFAKILNQLYENIYIDRKGIDFLYQLYNLTSINSTPVIPSSPITISSTLFAILNTFSRSSSSSITSETNFSSSPLTTKHYLTSPRILYLPTHRSYMDFIILTYLCYEYNLPLPCIAAAEDFLNLGLVANLLRHCGAFFIRRSFRSDLLYWTIFDEYVKTHIIHGDYPIEFFIEGARSRTLKSLLPPRQGMLKSCLECYFRRQIDNLILIPISINYEKILEDNLHANELLGIPKPKESKSGLLKATQILKKSFGSMIVRFSQPISIHDIYEKFQKDNMSNQDPFERSIPRGIQPRFICQQNGFNQNEEKFLEEISYRIINEQQRLTVIYPITIAAWSILNSSTRSISIEQILEEKHILFSENIGVIEYFSTNYQISWPSDNDENIIKQRLLTIYPDDFQCNDKNHLSLKLTGEKLTDSALLMKLIMYRNTCLHLFAKPVYVLLACQFQSQSSISYEQLRMFYHFFLHLFVYEFVYDQYPKDDDLSEKNFDEYLRYWLNKTYLLLIDQNSYKINPIYSQQISLMTKPFEQYARAYLVIYEQENLFSETNLSTIIKLYQKNLLNKLDSQNLISILASSSNVITNALRLLNENQQKSNHLFDVRFMLRKCFPSISTDLRAKL